MAYSNGVKTVLWPGGVKDWFVYKTNNWATARCQLTRKCIIGETADTAAEPFESGDEANVEDGIC
jgi:hypothetical protein